MSTGSSHTVLRFLRRIVVAQGDELPDAALIARFLINRDPSAFAAILRRHGPMVYRVCRRVLADTPEAEDAFQATFLVFLKRAASLKKPDLLGPWLYGVARRTARKAGSRRRQGVPLEGRGDIPVYDRASEPEQLEFQRAIDEELERLPEKYRTALVLCCLQDHSHAQAARLLDCPRETLTTRLCRARTRLQTRLRRRGFALPAAAGAALLLPGGAAAMVPPLLVERTLDAGWHWAQGAVASAHIPASVLALTKGVLRSMWFTQTKCLGAGLLVALALIGGVWISARSPVVAEEASLAPNYAADLSQGSTPRALRQPGGPASSVKDTAPVVIRTVPAAGDTQVDAAKVTEIRVTFSKDMQDNSWSWTQTSKETYPKTTGKPFFDKDKRTCVLPVKLEPSKAYVIWLNPQRFQGFRDTDGKPAVFYPLVFETKP